DTGRRALRGGTAGMAWLASRSRNQMEEKTSMPSDSLRLNAPGLKRRGKKRDRLYWIARTDIAKAGYSPRVVRLSYNISDPGDHRLIEAACQRLDAEMKSWSHGKKNAPK